MSTADDPTRQAPAESASTQAGAPAVLRHEGPMKVTLPEGGHSALSSAANLGSGRLRPAVGPVPPALVAGAEAAGLGFAGRRLRSPLAPTAGSGVTRTPAPARPRFVFTPDAAGPDAAELARSTAELERRLNRLAQSNLEVSRQVTSLEAELQTAAAPRRSTT